MERLLWEAKASFCLTSLLTAWNATQKASGYKKAILWVSARNQFLPAPIDGTWADIKLGSHLHSSLEIKSIHCLWVLLSRQWREPTYQQHQYEQQGAYLWSENIELIWKGATGQILKSVLTVNPDREMPLLNWNTNWVWHKGWQRLTFYFSCSVLFLSSR